VTNRADVPDLTTWKTVSTFADASAAGLSRDQADPNNFGYTFAATVEGANFQTQVVNGTKVRVTLTPTPSYTIWFTAASRLNAPNHDSVTQARNQLAGVKTTGYGTTLTNYRNWWLACLPSSGQWA
jgi:alpha-L-fucosidase 2